MSLSLISVPVFTVVVCFAAGVILQYLLTNKQVSTCHYHLSLFLCFQWLLMFLNLATVYYYLLCLSVKNNWQRYTICLIQIENIVRHFGLVCITRCGSNPEKFIYESDVLTKYKASYNCFIF